MIEVLVSVLVLLVGVLGVVSMQMVSFEANRGAYYRSQAVFIASQILDAMRANTAALPDYQITIDPADLGSLALPSDPGCATSAAGCSAADMADLDLRQWAAHFVKVDAGQTDYQPSLPFGGAQVQRDGDEYTVQVTWRQRGFDDDNSDGSDQRSVVQQAVTLSAVITP